MRYLSVNAEFWLLYSKAFLRYVIRPQCSIAPKAILGIAIISTAEIEQKEKQILLENKLEFSHQFINRAAPVGGEIFD